MTTHILEVAERMPTASASLRRDGWSPKAPCELRQQSGTTTPASRTCSSALVDTEAVAA